MAHPVDSLSSGCRLHWENNLGFVASGASSRTKPWIAITTVIITIHPVITQDRRNYQNTYYSYHVLSLSLSSLMPFLLCVYIYVIIHQGPWVCPGMSAPASMAVSLGYHLSIRLSLRGTPIMKRNLGWHSSRTFSHFWPSQTGDFLTNWSIGKLNWSKRGTDRHRRDAWEFDPTHVFMQVSNWLVHSSWCPNHLVDLKYKLDWPD